MAQATSKKSETPTLTSHVGRGLREAALIIFGAIAVYLLLALISYDPSDPAWSQSRAAHGQAHNAGGIVGAWFADVFLFLFGYLAFLVPLMAGGAGWLLFKGRSKDASSAPDFPHFVLRGLGFLLTVSAGTGIATLHFAHGADQFDAGGVLGQIVSDGLVSVFSFLGATLFLLALLLTGISLFTGVSWLRLMDATGRGTLTFMAYLRRRWIDFGEARAARRARQERKQTVRVENAKQIKRKPPKIEPPVKRLEASVRVEKEKQVPLFEAPVDVALPSLSLLDPPDVRKNNVSPAALEATSRQVELKLKDFGIEVQVVAVLPGPVITRYEIQPAPGVKVNQITNLAKDLARSLSVISVRVVEVIPGKSVVGLEIPNEQREVVRLIEVLQSKEYGGAASPLTLALGKDISGYPVVADLARMPHLLVAGTTGSGKSVAVNAMILSLLFNSTPEQVRLIMIDPKMLELSIYEGIPHLLAPVVTDMKDAAHALRWSVAEMDRRYKLMAATGVRNIAGFNRKVKEAIENGKPLKDPLYKLESLDDEAPELTTLPYIVVIVDELADMMMLVGKKVEELIARLAQKARAAGVHLILATQRPSVDVITGLIKANIPTRIAFQVSSKIDSRTIIDQMGAEQLLGHGDMLYLPPGTGVPVRVHGAFVADQEVHKVVDDLKRRGQPDYIDAVISGSSDEEGGDMMGGDDGAEADPLYDQAVRIVTESRRASISGIQRRLKVGYNRAARMVEDMERAGVVGPLQSNGAREVLAPPPPDR